MAGRSDCCRYNPSLDELLEDEMMGPVLRSAGLDSQGFREMIAETARRFDPLDEEVGPLDEEVGGVGEG